MPSLYARAGRSGFTLIELLVVIAIIAILIGLLLPAVQKVREAAARMSCQNNMKQLALACHTYADANNGLPSALIAPANSNTPNNSSGYGPGWVILILPYIEQSNLYNQYSTSINNWVSGANYNDNNWRGMGSTTIKTLLCPSDPNTALPYTGSNAGTWARGDYAANQGPTGNAALDGGSTNITVNGVSMSGRGPFWITTKLPHRCMTIQGIQDGSSNTILLGEVTAGAVATDPRGVWGLGHIGSSSLGQYALGDDVLINATNSGADDVQGCSDQPPWLGCCSGCNSNQQTLRSRHTSGANVALGDGTVRFVTNSLSQTTYFQAGSANDGMVLGSNW